MEPYIIGGHSAKIEQFSHTVFVFLTCSEVSWICGGSVLTQNLVLTAAHCLSTCHQDLDVVVYVGHSDLRKIKVARHISLYMVHQDFNPQTCLNDIALTRTHKDLPLGRTVKKVIIQRQFPSVTQAQVAGWGVLDEARYLSTDRLQWLPQSFRPGGLCSQFALAPGMMCIENNVDSRPSMGDSGCALTTNFVHQIGLVSFRHPGIKHLVIYTNVSYYYDWIKSGARQLTCMTD